MTSDSTWLCGFRFDDDNEYPDLYTVLVASRDEGPIVSRGRIVFFTRLELAPSALAMDDDPDVRASELPELTIDETYIFDVPDILAMIALSDRDDTALLIDFLNILLDMVKATRAVLPENYQTVLHRFANHLTLEHDFAGFLEREGTSRGEIRDGIYWCFGAIAGHMTLAR